MKRIAVLLALLICPIAYGQDPQPEQKVDRPQTQEPVTIETAPPVTAVEVVTHPIEKTQTHTVSKNRGRRFRIAFWRR
jgi:hypothetical protein